MDEFRIEPEDWYYRDKTQEPGPRPCWRATWPEGSRDEMQTVNFIGQLYFSAPNREAALREFHRWALVRLQDIPCIVLEQINQANVPCCPRPVPDDSGQAEQEGAYRLA